MTDPNVKTSAVTLSEQDIRIFRAMADVLRNIVERSQSQQVTLSGEFGLFLHPEIILTPEQVRQNILNARLDEAMKKLSVNAPGLSVACGYSKKFIADLRGGRAKLKPRHAAILESVTGLRFADLLHVTSVAAA